MSQRKRINKKKNGNTRNRLLPWLVFASLLLVVASAVLVVLIRNHSEATKGSEFPLGANAISGFDCDYSEAQRIYPFGEGLLKVTATRVVFMSVSGKEIYSFDMKMETPICVIRGEYAFVADQGGFFYACLSETGILYSGSVSGKIGYAELSDKGYGALIFDEENTNGAVSVIDPSGVVIAQWNSVESGYPVSSMFSPQSSLLSIALIDTDGSHMQPNLKQIHIPDPTSGDKPHDHAFISAGEAEILSSISYLGEDRLVWSGNSSVFALTLGTLLKIDYYFPNILSVTTIGDRVGVFYTEGIGQQVLLSTIDSSFNVSTPIVLGDQLKSFSSFGNKVLIAIDDKMLIVDATRGEVSKERTVDEDIIRVQLSSEQQAVIVTSSGVREIRF